MSNISLEISHEILGQDERKISLEPNQITESQQLPETDAPVDEETAKKVISAIIDAEIDGVVLQKKPMNHLPYGKRRGGGGGFWWNLPCSGDGNPRWMCCSGGVCKDWKNG